MTANDPQLNTAGNPIVDGDGNPFISSAGDCCCIGSCYYYWELEVSCDTYSLWTSGGCPPDPISTIIGVSIQHVAGCGTDADFPTLDTWISSPICDGRPRYYKRGSADCASPDSSTCLEDLTPPDPPATVDEALALINGATAAWDLGYTVNGLDGVTQGSSLSGDCADVTGSAAYPLPASVSVCRQGSPCTVPAIWSAMAGGLLDVTLDIQHFSAGCFTCDGVTYESDEVWLVTLTVGGVFMYWYKVGGSTPVGTYTTLPIDCRPFGGHIDPTCTTPATITVT